MPVYEYACEKCQREFEIEQRISDAPLSRCPKCRSRKVKRLISKTAFVLKGGGWYSDLYASAKPDAKGGDSDAPSADAASAAESKAEKSEKASAEKKPAKKGKKGSKAAA